MTSLFFRHAAFFLNSDTIKNKEPTQIGVRCSTCNFNEVQISRKQLRAFEKMVI